LTSWISYQLLTAFLRSIVLNSHSDVIRFITAGTLCSHKSTAFGGVKSDITAENQVRRGRQSGAGESLPSAVIFPSTGRASAIRNPSSRSNKSHTRIDRRGSVGYNDRGTSVGDSSYRVRVRRIPSTRVGDLRTLLLAPAQSVQETYGRQSVDSSNRSGKGVGSSESKDSNSRSSKG
jgi:hypothetical protein